MYPDIILRLRVLIHDLSRLPAELQETPRYFRQLALALLCTSGDLGAIISVLALALLDSLRREVLLVLGLRSLILDSWD